MFYRTDGPVLPHWRNQQSGWWLIYHHLIHPDVHTYILFVLQIAHHHTYIYIYIYIHTYSVSPHKVKYLFYHTDRPPSCIYIYSLFHHTELTYVLPHICPSFTTLGKPTIWMMTYLSPSYKPICTHIILFVLQISHYHTYIYIYIYTLFHHTELSICFTAQIAHYHTYIYIYAPFHHTESTCFFTKMAQFYRTDSPLSYIYIYIYTPFHHTESTYVFPHRWPSFTTLGKPTIWMVTYLSPSYKPICTHIHTYILFVLQISHYHTYIYIDTLFHHTELSICFTAQIAHYQYI